MTQAQDAPKAEPLARYSNPATQAGFIALPVAVALRGDLSAESKLVYGYLGWLAWRERSSTVGPAREVIASDLAMSVKAVTKAIKALCDAPTQEGAPAAAPFLVEGHRRGLGRTNVYVVNDPEMGHSGKAVSASLDAPDSPFPARARSFSEPKKTTTEEEPPNPPLDDPPGIVLIGGRNLPLDALVEVCGITSSQMNTRMGQAVVALNGKHDRRGDLTEPGIRHVFWDECVEQATGGDRRLLEDSTSEATLRLRLLQNDSPRFARLLSDRIRAKAAAYRTNMPGAILSPKSLRDWWYDIGTGARPASAGKDFSHLPDA